MCLCPTNRLVLNSRVIKSQHIIKRDRVKPAGVSKHQWIAVVDTIHPLDQATRVGMERLSKKYCRQIGPPPSKKTRLSRSCATHKSRNNQHASIIKRLVNGIHVNSNWCGIEHRTLRFQTDGSSMQHMRIQAGVAQRQIKHGRRVALPCLGQSRDACWICLAAIFVGMGQQAICFARKGRHHRHHPLAITTVSIDMLNHRWQDRLAGQDRPTKFVEWGSSMITP